jgi:hypothetical protein
MEEGVADVTDEDTDEDTVEYTVEDMDEDTVECEGAVECEGVYVVLSANEGSTVVNVS